MAVDPPRAVEHVGPSPELMSVLRDGRAYRQALEEIMVAARPSLARSDETGELARAVMAIAKGALPNVV